MPIAAIIAPPGTPGAATMAMPIRKMNSIKVPSSTGIPEKYMNAIEKAMILSVLPDR